MSLHNFAAMSATNAPNPWDAVMRSLRLGLGLALVYSVVRFWVLGWAASHFAPGQFAFHYYGLAWVPHPGLVGLQLLQAAQLLGALAMLHRPWARVGAGLFVFSFVWMQTLDATWYLNHYYFVALMALGLAVVPGTAGGASRLTVAWFRLQTGVLYTLAGLFKMQPTWLLEAMPLRIWMNAQRNLPVLGPLLTWPPMAWLFSWGGMLYDTFIPFVLMHRRLWWLGYVAVVGFHVMVGLMFDIGVFPLVMILVAPVFFPSARHLRFWQWADARLPWLARVQGEVALPSRPVGRVWQWVFAGWFAFHILFPFRYLLYPGSLFWHEQGFRFSWRVMLMEKAGTATFYVLDRRTGRWGTVNNADFLSPEQEKMMSTQPDFILQYAHHLARKAQAQGMPDPAVRAEVYVTLNGRPSRLMIDPNRDLAKIDDGLRPYDWVTPSP